MVFKPQILSTREEKVKRRPWGRRSLLRVTRLCRGLELALSDNVVERILDGGPVGREPRFEDARIHRSEPELLPQLFELGPGRRRGLAVLRRAVLVAVDVAVFIRLFGREFLEPAVSRLPFEISSHLSHWLPQSHRSLRDCCLT